MTVADKMFCSHILPACSLITAQLPFSSHTARDQEHNREEFPFKPAITRFKALIWHKRTQKQRDTPIHLLSFCRLGSAAGCLDETSAAKWLKYKMREDENLSRRGENTKPGQRFRLQRQRMKIESEIRSCQSCHFHSLSTGDMNMLSELS